MKLYNKIMAVALICVSGFMITGCEKNDDAAPVNNIDTLISQNANLTLFRAALDRTGMETFAKGPGPFTFFVPNDNAFKAIGINTAADIEAVDMNALTVLLGYHIMNNKRTLVEIPNGPNAPASSVNGLTFYASKNANGAFINGVKIVTSDVLASNGTMHIIDRVLNPPVGNMITYFSTNPNFKLFMQAITKAAVTTNFNPAATAPVTVFAPTNAAMIAGGYDSTTIANSTGATLGNILKYHIVTGRMFSSEFKALNYKTVHGSNITLSSGLKIKGITNATAGNIVNPDWLASNGVVHAVDILLKY